MADRPQPFTPKTPKPLFPEGLNFTPSILIE